VRWHQAQAAVHQQGVPRRRFTNAGCSGAGGCWKAHAASNPSTVQAVRKRSRRTPSGCRICLNAVIRPLQQGGPGCSQTRQGDLSRCRSVRLSLSHCAMRARLLVTALDHGTVFCQGRKDLSRGTAVVLIRLHPSAVRSIIIEWLQCVRSRLANASFFTEASTSSVRLWLPSGARWICWYRCQKKNACSLERPVN
jgi:hypothetical protein